MKALTTHTKGTLGLGSSGYVCKDKGKLFKCRKEVKNWEWGGKENLN